MKRACSKTRLVLEQALGKIGQKPGFSTKSKEAVPKTEVLEQPQDNIIKSGVPAKIVKRIDSTYVVLSKT
jgi:hypothetical protein